MDKKRAFLIKEASQNKHYMSLKLSCSEEAVALGFSATDAVISPVSNKMAIATVSMNTVHFSDLNLHKLWIVKGSCPGSFYY